MSFFKEISGNQIVFSGNYTLEEYQTVARSLVYINTNDELMCPLNRTIQLTIEDEWYVQKCMVAKSPNCFPISGSQAMLQCRFLLFLLMTNHQ